MLPLLRPALLQVPVMENPAAPPLVLELPHLKGLQIAVPDRGNAGQPVADHYSYRLLQLSGQLPLQQTDGSFQRLGR
ncbi:hypothetical protein D3C75_645500 [compost metagenome]